MVVYFLNSFHSVTIMQQSASFRQLIGDEEYSILFTKRALVQEGEFIARGT